MGSLCNASGWTEEPTAVTHSLEGYAASISFQEGSPGQLSLAGTLETQTNQPTQDNLHIY